MNPMDPNIIILNTPSKSFAYEKMSRDIEECKDVKILQNALRCYVKLYFKQQETMSIIGLPDQQTQFDGDS